MRAGACTVLGIAAILGAILIAAPAWAAGGRYDPDYPVCMEAIESQGTRLDCMYTSFEQCRLGTVGSSGSCFMNPNYVPRPAAAAPAPTEQALPVKPKKPGRYDPDYAVCMESYGSDGTRVECSYTSIEQCKLGATGTPGTCSKNPYYVPPAPEVATAPQTEPAKPVKPAKSPKSAKSAKSLQSPPLPQPAPSQVH
jgi:Protein of unknown function (DUF3551)